MVGMVFAAYHAKAKVVYDLQQRFSTFFLPECSPPPQHATKTPQSTCTTTIVFLHIQYAGGWLDKAWGGIGDVWEGRIRGGIGDTSRGMGEHAPDLCIHSKHGAVACLGWHEQEPSLWSSGWDPVQEGGVEQ